MTPEQLAGFMRGVVLMNESGAPPSAELWATIRAEVLSTQLRGPSPTPQLYPSINAKTGGCGCGCK